jgi:hypothetical protein
MSWSYTLFEKRGNGNREKQFRMTLSTGKRLDGKDAHAGRDAEALISLTADGLVTVTERKEWLIERSSHSQGLRDSLGNTRKLIDIACKETIHSIVTQRQRFPPSPASKYRQPTLASHKGHQSNHPKRGRSIQAVGIMLKQFHGLCVLVLELRGRKEILRKGNCSTYQLHTSPAALVINHQGRTSFVKSVNQSSDIFIRFGVRGGPSPSPA